MDVSEIKNKLNSKGWNLSLWFKSETTAKMFYEDLGSILSVKEEMNVNEEIDYKSEMINYANKKGL